MSVRYSNNHDSRRYRDWLERAGADLSAMRLLLQHGGDLPLAVFHGHQAVEKAFKAYLLFVSRQHVDGHNLIWLCRQALKQDGAFALFLPYCARMNHFYIESRYPTDFPLEVSELLAKEILLTAEKLVRKVSQSVEND